MDFYDILGVSPSASSEDIKNAYKQQIKFFHPDLNNVSKEIAELKTQQLNEAYAVLKNSQKRARYDSQRSYKREEGRTYSQPPEDNNKTKSEAKSEYRHKKGEEKNPIIRKAVFWASTTLLAALFFFAVINLMSVLYSRFTNTPAQKVTKTPLPVVSSNPKNTEKPAWGYAINPSSTHKPEYRTIMGRNENTIVYVSKDSVIHLKEDCSGMSRYSLMTLGQAYDKGYTLCGICFR